jgi:hypothetical protein
MHLTLKKEATRPAGENFLQQQAKFDRFIPCYNYERAHQALNMKYSAASSTPPHRGPTKAYATWSTPSTIAPSP